MSKVIRQIAIDAAWAPLSILIAHAVAGGVFGHEPFVDPVMHFLGGAAACFFFRRAAEIARSTLGSLTRFGLDLFSYALACSMATFWEIGEFVADELLKGNAQRGLANTMRDLILGILGAGVFLLLLRSGAFFRVLGDRKKGAYHRA